MKTNLSVNLLSIRLPKVSRWKNRALPDLTLKPLARDLAQRCEARDIRVMVSRTGLRIIDASTSEIQRLPYYSAITGWRLSGFVGEMAIKRGSTSEEITANLKDVTTKPTYAMYEYGIEIADAKGNRLQAPIMTWRNLYEGLTLAIKGKSNQKEESWGMERRNKVFDFELEHLSVSNVSIEVVMFLGGIVGATFPLGIASSFHDHSIYRSSFLSFHMLLAISDFIGNHPLIYFSAVALSAVLGFVSGQLLVLAAFFVADLAFCAVQIVPQALFGIIRLLGVVIPLSVYQMGKKGANILIEITKQLISRLRFDKTMSLMLKSTNSENFPISQRESRMIEKTHERVGLQLPTRQMPKLTQK